MAYRSFATFETFISSVGFPCFPRTSGSTGLLDQGQQITGSTNYWIKTLDQTLDHNVPYGEGDVGAGQERVGGRQEGPRKHEGGL